MLLHGKAVLKPVRTKTTMCNGGVELVVIRSRLAASVLRLACEGKPNVAFVLSRRPEAFRQVFKDLVVALHLDSCNLALCSLRRDGASHDVRSHGSMEKTLLRGRLGLVSSRARLCPGRRG